MRRILIEATVARNASDTAATGNESAIEIGGNLRIARHFRVDEALTIWRRRTDGG
jgi:hypothetical protein